MANDNVIRSRLQRREKLDQVVEMVNAALAERGDTDMVCRRIGDNIGAGPRTYRHRAGQVSRVNSTDHANFEG